MKRLLPIIALLAVLGLMLAGCGGGKYVHDAGDCSLKNGRVQVEVWAYRDKSVPDSEAKAALTAACNAANKALRTP